MRTTLWPAVLWFPPLMIQGAVTDSRPSVLPPLRVRRYTPEERFRVFPMLPEAGVLLFAEVGLRKSCCSSFLPSLFYTLHQVAVLSCHPLRHQSLGTGLLIIPFFSITLIF